MLQEVLFLVHTSGDQFDAVCMATALHKMATMEAGGQQHTLQGTEPDLQRLKDMICKLIPGCMPSSGCIP